MAEKQKSEFFSVEDSTKIKSFLQIPKELFVNDKYKNLSLVCKLAYSIYLNRYTTTKYRDDKGPYIIFGDTEISKLLDTPPQYVATIRRKLKEAKLLDYRRGVSYNKIYLYSYTTQSAEEDNIFFYENTLDTWKFYRFPNDFFEDKFVNLPLKAKFIYTMYFDAMCASQANYFVDNKERIYFQDSIYDQELKSNLTTTTIRKYRDYLKACNLLFEYAVVTQKTRYYLLRLEMYEDNVFKFENMSVQEKKEYIKMKNDTLKNKLIVEKDKNVKDIEFIKVSLKKLKLKHKDVIELIYSNLEKELSVQGLRKYLNRSRNMPDDVYDFLLTYCQERTGETPDSIEVNEPEKKEDKFILIMNNLIAFNKQSNILVDIDKEFINSSLSTLRQSRRFTITNKNKKYEESELINIMSHLGIHDFEYLCIDILNKITESNYQFKTPGAQINCFLTFMINELDNSNSTPSWFKENTNIFAIDIYKSRNNIHSGITFSDDVKDYKWWEEN